MYASVRRYRCQPDQVDEMLHLVDTDFAETLSAMEGFVAYEVIAEEDKLVTLSVFRDREAADASAEAAADWVRDNLAARYDIERLEAITGELAVSRARRELLEPAHH